MNKAMLCCICSALQSCAANTRLRATFFVLGRAATTLMTFNNNKVLINSFETHSSEEHVLCETPER